MKIMCSRCDKEVENASPYNFYVLHKECLRDHAEQLIDEFCKDLKYLEEYDSELDAADMRFLREKWEARKNED